MTSPTASGKPAFFHLDNTDPWMLAEDIPNLDFFFSQVWLQSFVNNLENSCGRNFRKILGVFESPDMKFYYGKADCRGMAEHLVRRIRNEASFGDAINANIIRYSDELEAHARTIPKDVSKLTNVQLCDLIEGHVRVHTQLYEWGWLSNATDMFYPEYTDYLKAYLRGRAESEEQVNQYFVTLTTPNAFSAEALQHHELLHLAEKIQADVSAHALFADGRTPTFDALPLAARKDVQAHVDAYAPISALWLGQPFGTNHYVEEIAGILHSNQTPKEELEKAKAEVRVKKAAKVALFKELDVDEKHRHLFRVFSEFMVSKFYRRYAQLRSLYALRRVFTEIAKRFGITPAQARLLLTQEYRGLLADGTFDTGQLQERSKFLVLYAEKGRNVILTFAAARELAASAEEKVDTSARELKGQCACLGKVQGAVKIILSAADMPKMRPGDVLVAIATNPDVVPAMRKAGAIVTEQGGVTCHAAIVSRELGIPCLIGIKHATRFFRDGDFVEVDASSGMIRRIS